MGDNDTETFANITRADYDFEDEAFNTVSQHARDFISALLVKRKEYVYVVNKIKTFNNGNLIYRDRLSAEQCLKHIWLDPENHQKTVILSTDKLKKFIIRRKWQVCIKFCVRKQLPAWFMFCVWFVFVLCAFLNRKQVMLYEPLDEWQHCRQVEEIPPPQQQHRRRDPPLRTILPVKCPV